MNTGTPVRINRFFSNPSGRLCSVAVDHFIGYAEGLPDGLWDIRPTLSAIVAAEPDAVTMHKGIAASAWQVHAGRVPMILQSTIARPDDSACEQIATPEDAVCLGADGFAVAAFVRGPTEAYHLQTVADCVRQAARFEMPVIVHIYPRGPDNSTISFQPEDIAWAVRCALEVGVDVIKTPYCGDVEAHRQTVSTCPLPMVAAGGPRAQTLESALAMIGEVVQSSTRGATIGRNVWGFERMTAAIETFKAVIHDDKRAAEALANAGL